MELVTDYTTGENAILATPPTVTIEGTDYRLRRLGMQDTLRIAKIVSIGANAAGMNLASFNDGDAAAYAGQVISCLVGGMPFAENQVLDLFASLLGVSGADIRNPDKFPMGSELLIGEALAQHPDITVFFAKLGGMLTKLLPPAEETDPESETPSDSSAD